MEGPIDMAIDKALLNQLLAGREPQDLFAKGGLIDDLKKALSERMLAAQLEDHLESEAEAGSAIVATAVQRSQCSPAHRN
jgi:putative transposase